jgi:hypothetical protein
MEALRAIYVLVYDMQTTGGPVELSCLRALGASKLGQWEIDLGYGALQYTHRHFLDLVHRGAHSHVVAQLCYPETLIFNSGCLSQAQNLPIYDFRRSVPH